MASSASTVMLKKALRDNVKKSLKMLTEAETERQSQLILEKLSSSKIYNESRRLSVYISTSYEVDTYPIIYDTLKNPNKTLFVPRIDSKAHTMEMFEIRSIEDFDSLPVAFWDIKQPPKSGLDSRKRALDVGLDLMIVPGVAFTVSGDRLGHGGGYYDSYLHRYQERYGHLPHLIGIAFREQMVDNVPMTETDVRIPNVMFCDDSR